MYEAYDDKGKIFTHVVTKRPVPVVIQTNHQRIEGKVHVRQDSRLKDEIDETTGFLAITDAVVFDMNGRETTHYPFMVVQRSHIVWLAPCDQE